MPKRHRPPSPSPSRLGKRPHPDQSSLPTQLGLRPLFDLDELFLRVLSFLSPSDLARAQAVSRRWSVIAVDPQLWKALYLERYPHPHPQHTQHSNRLRANARASRAASWSVGGSGGSTPLRPIARLPSRAFPPPSPSPSPAPRAGDRDGEGGADRGDEEWRRWTEQSRHDGVDWKVIMRLGTNWSNGAVLAEARVPLPPSPSRDSDHPAHPTPSETPSYAEHRLALFPSFICTSNPASPLVHVYTSLPTSPAPPLGIVPPPPGWSSPHRPDTVTAIAADQSVSPRDAASHLPARLVIMYASGGFAVVRLRIADERLHWSRESVWTSRTRPPRLHSHSHAGNGDPVVLASMYYPALVACTKGFVLSVFSLEGAEPVLLRTLRSDVSFHPAALAVYPPSETVANRGTDKAGPKGSFRAALTYSAPVYPASWTVAVQELLVDIPRRDVERTETITLNLTPEGTWPRRLTPLAGVRGRAVGVGSDGRWCVLAGDDAVIYVYALPDSDERTGIKHAQTLLAPSTGVASLALQGGKCVIGGRDGRVLVWDLDEAVDLLQEEEEAEARVGRVAAVEVKRGGRRRPASDPLLEENAVEEGEEAEEGGRLPLPHPTAISRVARGLFLATPPATLPPAIEKRSVAGDEEDGSPAIRQLAFDEEKIVGLVDGPAGDVMRVWSFG